MSQVLKSTAVQVVEAKIRQTSDLTFLMLAGSLTRQKMSYSLMILLAMSRMKPFPSVLVLGVRL